VPRSKRGSRRPAFCGAVLVALVQCCLAGALTAQLLPDTLFRIPGGAQVALFTPPPGGEGVAVLRLSVSIHEHPLEEGASDVLAHLALDRMSGARGPTAARVSTDSSPWGVSYTVEGVEEDLDYLGYILRIAVSRPDLNSGFERRIRALREDRLSRRSESPGNFLVSRLLSAALPSGAGSTGFGWDAPEISSSALVDIWARTHRPEAMRVVVHSSAEPTVVLAALGRLGNPDEPALGLEGVPFPTRLTPRRPELIRRWYGSLWIDDRQLDPRAPILARLIAGKLSSGTGELELASRLIVLRNQSAHAVIGAAYGRRASRARDAVRSVLSAVRSELDETEVLRLARSVAIDYRSGAASPAGMIDVVGRAWDATGRVDGADLYLRALRTLSSDDIVAYIDALSGPVQDSMGP